VDMGLTSVDERGLRVSVERVRKISGPRGMK
jgi:hypothetical protein